MPLMERGVQALTDRMPKVISPKAHAIIDYAVAGSFFLLGALAWRNNKKAAIASLVCGGAELGTAMMTDYPGGVTKLISFSTHGKIDAGFAGVIGSMPNLIGFSGEWPAWFFRSQGMGMAAVTGLTDFEAVTSNRRRTARYRAA